MLLKTTLLMSLIFVAQTQVFGSDDDYEYHTTTESQTTVEGIKYTVHVKVSTYYEGAGQIPVHREQEISIDGPTRIFNNTDNLSTRLSCVDPCSRIFYLGNEYYLSLDKDNKGKIIKK